MLDPELSEKVYRRFSNQDLIKELELVAMGSQRHDEMELTRRLEQAGQAFYWTPEGRIKTFELDRLKRAHGQGAPASVYDKYGGKAERAPEHGSAHER